MIFGNFLNWWGRQLFGLVPERLRRESEQRDGDAIVLELAETRQSDVAVVDAVRRRGSRDVPLGRFPLDDGGLDRLRAAVGTARRRSVRMMLPDRILLERDVSLPLAAERGLETALRWEMDRLTPFTADAVFWSWHVTARDRARGLIALQLRLVPKAAIATALERLAAAGLGVSVLASARAPGRVVPLDRHDADRHLGAGFIALAALCAVLVVTAIGLPLVRQEIAFRRVDRRIAAMRPDVDLADGMRRRLAERGASVDVMATEADRVGDPLRMLSTVTEDLPDGSFLYGLRLRNRVLTISGQSAAAATLIPSLAADPAIADPVFAAPVTRNEADGAEAFTIRAELKR